MGRNPALRRIAIVAAAFIAANAESGDTHDGGVVAAGGTCADTGAQIPVIVVTTWNFTLPP